MRLNPERLWLEIGYKLELIGQIMISGKSPRLLAFENSPT
jgi:hypothetical protein